MKLRTKYILFVIVLHLAALILTFFIFEKKPILFIAAEIVILISAILTWQLYRQLIKPLQLIVGGMESLRDQDFNTRLLLTGTYEMDQLILTYNEMIGHLRQERVLLEEQHVFLEKLIETSPTGIVIYDLDGNIFKINPKAAGILNPPLLQEIGRLGPGESRTVSLNGSGTYKLQKSHFIDRGFLRYFVMIGEMTNEILEAEKKAYGKIIRLMAHEVNNTIGPVNSILQSTLQSRQHDDAIGRALQIAIERNNNLNHFMRNYADLVRLPPPDKRPMDMIQLIRRVTDLMRLQAGKSNVEFRMEHSLPRLEVVADNLQMEHVLINIIKNSLEAMDGEGVLTIFVKADPPEVVIRDTGKGISTASEEWLFTPFFSTRKDGQGIGLTLVREILINHGFRFSLKTLTPGVTEFSILL
jgi:nitrogen fixation/metabolism regulation signal transduction histidine kinase